MKITNELVERKINFYTEETEKSILKCKREDRNYINEIYANFKGKIEMLWILDLISIERYLEITGKISKLVGKRLYGI